mgnify:CR=1 FL=1
MKKLLAIIICMTLTMGVGAQENNQPEKFSPEKFDAELQEFITNEAKLTQQEAARFFPILKEMHSKQREIFAKQKNLGKNKPQDEKSCQKAIGERDEMELELKRIQQTYHERFLEILPASKVYDIIQAEDKFHRHMLKKWSRDRRPEHPERPRQHQK